MSKQKVIVDTGPLVSLLKKQDQFHHWVKSQWANIEPPLLTCESVISETCFLLRNTYAGPENVVSLVKIGVIQVTFRFQEEAKVIEELMSSYQSVPMSLADACLVRMSELYSTSSILTLDSDFRIYRKNRNQIIPLIMPDNI